MGVSLCLWKEQHGIPVSLFIVFPVFVHATIPLIQTHEANQGKGSQDILRRYRMRKQK